MYINEIPGDAQGRNPALYLPKDSLPRQPYIEVMDLHVLEKRHTDNATLIKKLLELAKQEGMDAVIDVSTESWSEENLSFAGLIYEVAYDVDMTTIRNYSEARGIGIKFLRNLKYIEEIPEFERFYLVTDNKKTPFMDLEYKLTGEIYSTNYKQDNAMTFNVNYFMPTTDFFLLKEREDWKYNHVSEFLSYRYKYDTFKNTKELTCKVRRNKEGKVHKINVVKQKTNQGPDYYNIKYTWDGDMISKKIVKYPNNSTLVIDYFYNEGKISKKHYKLIRAEKVRLELQSIIHTYPGDYLHGYYEHLQAEKAKKVKDVTPAYHQDPSLPGVHFSILR